VVTVQNFRGKVDLNAELVKKKFNYPRIPNFLEIFVSII